MNRFLLILALISLFSLPSWSQLCPGGGTDFNSAVAFDPEWIYGCTTGTSCNGGVVFDNRSACEPTTQMDACAPNPSCTAPENNGSDIWFKFYPSNTNVTIVSTQNTSLIIGIQAFNQGGTCGALTEIGCAVSGGPSSGVSLGLTGLQVGALYYFRIFGSSSSVSQRTGLYCFCGTTGVEATVLAPTLFSLSGIFKNNVVELRFLKPEPGDNATYEIEYSTDGSTFNVIDNINESHISFYRNKATYLHTPKVDGTNYYRLKRTEDNGRYKLSSIIVVTVNRSTSMKVFSDVSRNKLHIEVSSQTTFFITSMSGQLRQTLVVQPGSHSLSTAHLSPGMYTIRNAQNGEVYKFIVSN